MTKTYIHTHIELVETLFLRFSRTIEEEILPYKNYVYRVINFYITLNPRTSKEEESKLIIATSFYILGLYYKKNLDYLKSSIDYAKEYLRENHLEKWIEEITLMIRVQQKGIFFQRRRDIVILNKASKLASKNQKSDKSVDKQFFDEIDIFFPDKGFNRILHFNRFKSFFSFGRKD